MKIYIYLRVSTNEQDTENQLVGIADYCKANGWTEFDIIRDSVSSKIDWVNRQVKKIIDSAQPGDLLIVSEISRLARSTLSVLQILTAAADKGLIVHAVKSRLIMDGSMSSKIMATVLGLAAEIEREFIQARTKESLQRLKDSGVKLGRPAMPAEQVKLDKLENDLAKWYRLDLNLTSIARLAGCSRMTLHRWLKRRKPDWYVKE